RAPAGSARGAPVPSKGRAPGPPPPPPPPPRSPAHEGQQFAPANRRRAHEGALARVAGGAVRLPPGLRAVPRLSDWVRIEAPGRVVACTGKVEIGQGILTALRLIVAEELDVDPQQVVVETAHTGRTPNEGITAGSMSLETSGAALRQAAAWLRRLLLERAAAELGVAPERIAVENGVLTVPGINRPLDYWQLGAPPPDFEIRQPTAEKSPATYRWVGVEHALRIDLPAKVRGEPAFVHDLPCDLYARVVRPPSLHHRLGAIDATIAAPAHLVVNGSFVAVAHPDEYTASRLSERVRSAATWHAPDLAPMQGSLADHLRSNETTPLPLDDGKPTHRPVRDFATTHHATYSRPFLMHGSLGPSAAWALWQGGRLLVRSSSQGIELLKAMLAKVLGLELEQVEVAHREGAGCYGHNGADDAALDAALVARALPDQAILLQWSRADEHRFEPLGPAMQVELGASTEGGAVSHWRHDVRGFTHSGRPAPQRPGVDMLAAWLLDEPFEPSPPQPGRGPESGLHRNALPLYEFPHQEVVKRLCTAAPLRTSSLRSLGAHCNVFAIESFMDELAQEAEVAPDEFRRRHLAHDPRALAVLNAAVRLAGGMDGPRGMAIARYKNRQCCAAIVVEVAVSDAAEVLVKRAWIAADAGRVVDRDGLINQLEGGFVQALSWTLFEEVSFDTQGVADTDWDDYPILRFSDVPHIETTLLDRPEQQPVGAGEALQGPTSAAVANAIFAATGIRPRDLPFTPANLRRAAAA
ncbi:MAG: xanthine dehydrogenase family protein molybdopterin-binding subunit, partial [Gammaproteobacteria bacterium]|nr:xanthine dehydrogenase family protein molybdopterin-binding subunit [Gammaproteobacteria bacterium]